jgi:hypothetical protein
MNLTEFGFWLKGCYELCPDVLEKGFTPAQTKAIHGHLQLAFTKVTPDRINLAPSPINSVGHPINAATLDDFIGRKLCSSKAEEPKIC